MSTPAGIGDVPEPVSDSYELRRGGVLAVSEENIYVVQEDEETVKISLDDVVEVQYDMYDWFLGIVSVAVVGYGLFSLRKNLLAGLGFTAVGLVSLFMTYRKRGKLEFKVSGRAKPLDVYPKNPKTAYKGLRPYMQ